MPESLPRLVHEYYFFLNRRSVQLPMPRSLRLAEEHPSIPRFDWDDEGKHFSAYFETTVTEDKVTFRFHFKRNNIPVSFLPILNSYKRFLIRENLDDSIVA